MSLASYIAQLIVAGGEKPALGGQVAHQGRGSADRGEYCEIAGAFLTRR
jgi:hypothetical protein